MINDFLSLGISKSFGNILKNYNITQPTPIQEKTIPVIMEGKDVIAEAQTGTGKTFAFMLPIMERVNSKKPDVQVLVITPTRELAIQITVEAKKLAAVNEVNILAAYGGQDVEQQIRKLKGSVHVIIATPGRLLDHVRRKTVDLSKVEILVLDEADQMLNMGFQQEVEQIIYKTPVKRQTLLFSATIPKGVSMLSSKYMNEPVLIRVQKKNITLDEIKQVMIPTTDRNKQQALLNAIDYYKPFMAIAFCRTKRRVSVLNEALQNNGYKSDELHGDLTQAKREKVMKAFRNAELQLLVATDVAARGLDIEGITHIFNYDIPQDAESYIHRIGRTGRAGQKGVAVTFVAPKDREALHLIEFGIKSKLEKEKEIKELPAGDKKTDTAGSRTERETVHKGHSKPIGSFSTRAAQGRSNKNTFMKGPSGVGRTREENRKNGGRVKNSYSQKPFSKGAGTMAKGSTAKRPPRGGRA